MAEEKQKKQECYSDEIVDLVIARLEAIPSNVSISVGGEDRLLLKEVIESVKKRDEIGIKFIEMQLNHIRSLKDLSAE